MWSSRSTSDLYCNHYPLSSHSSLHLCLFSSWQEIHKLSGASKGFNGAIQRVLLNGQPLPISANMPLCSFVPLNVTGCGFKIEPYDGLPCPISKNPCLNKGSCMPNLGEYSCRCDAGYTGKHCEVSTSDGGSIKFNGATFLQYKNRGYRR